MHHDKDRIKSKASAGGSDQAAENQNLDRLVRGQAKHATMALLQNPDGDYAGNWERLLTNKTTYRSARSRPAPQALVSQLGQWDLPAYQESIFMYRSLCTDMRHALPDFTNEYKQFVPAVKNSTYYHLRGSDTARPLVLYFQK